MTAFELEREIKKQPSKMYTVLLELKIDFPEVFDHIATLILGDKNESI